VSTIPANTNAYAVLANAAYVDLSLVDIRDGTAVATRAEAQEVLPIDLARATFDPDSGGTWETVDYNDQDNPTTGFAATLFGRASATGDEYVLAIRGTETEGDQLRTDLVGADVEEIGFIGMALSQTVSLVKQVFL
jgi:hypothetical protein